MKSTSIPGRTNVAFASQAAAANKNSIAQTSTTTSLAEGVATFDVGFPPQTMTSVASGGEPPSGADMNGILYFLSLKQQWADAGMGSSFDSAFAGSISGYPAGAVIPSSDSFGCWLNQSDSNITDPESTSSSSTGWVPFIFYGATSLSGLASSSITLTPLQAARSTISLSGTLTKNISIYVPLWIKDWRIENKCTGNYTISFLTPSSGASAVIPGPGTFNIHCDGINVSLLPSAAGMVPIGVPIPYPGKTAPSRYLLCNGDSFPPSYTELAALYPDLKTPDIRGLFIRGWDNGAGIDNGRTLLSKQNATLIPSDDGVGVTTAFSINNGLNSGSGWNLDTPNYTPEQAYASQVNDAVQNNSITPQAYGGARPANISMNYILRAY